MKNSPSPENTAAQTELFLAVCGFAIFVFTALWAVFFVPMNMDEAGLYHVLACFDYPFAPLHTFRESCAQQTTLTMPLFGLHVVQPGWYTGLLSPALYAPFYFLLHIPEAQYVFGLCFFVGFAFLLSRQTRKPLLSLSIFLSFFPFVFQFIHDTGPAKFALLCFPLSVLLFKNILRQRTPLTFGYAALLALLFLAATEDKPFFLYLLPSLGFFILALASDQPNIRDAVVALKKARAPLLFGIAIAIAGLLLIFFSVNQDGKYYLSWLMDMSVSEIKSSTPWIELFAAFFFYWPAYAHYFFDMPLDTTGAIILELATGGLCLLSIFIVLNRKLLSSYSGTRFILLGLSFMATAIVFAVMGNTWAGHHFIFMWVPLIVLFADVVAGLTPGLAMGLTAIFFILNLCSVTILTQATVQVRSSDERTAIFHFFDDEARASHEIVNYSTWGGYYIQALYGPKNQLVTYTEPLTPDDGQKLLALAQQTNRKIYDVCYGPWCNETMLKGAFGDNVDFENALPGLPNWRVFAITPRPR